MSSMLLAFVIHPFNILERKIFVGVFFLVFRCGNSTEAIPVNVLPCPLSINVFAVFYIEPPVIVLGIIGAVFTGTTIMPG